MSQMDSAADCIDTGDVLVDQRDIYGNSVNITARLELSPRRAPLASAKASTIKRAGNPTYFSRTTDRTGSRTFLTLSASSRLLTNQSVSRSSDGFSDAEWDGL